jgi:hypothetical protein
VDASRAKLSQSSLLHRVGQYGDQHPDLGGPYSWGRSEFWLWLGPFKGRGQQPLGESARAHFYLLVSISASQRIHILKQDLGYVCGTLQGVNRINNERLQEQRQRRHVEGGEELACSQVASAERLLHDTLALPSRDVQHPL